MPPNVSRLPTPAGSAPKEASPAQPTALAPFDFTDEQLAVLKASARCEKLSTVEFRMFVEMARRRRLDPFVGQLFAIVREGTRGPRTVTYQTSIDGFRVIAERSGKYEGQVGPFWCGTDGKWTRAWLLDAPPAAARVGVYKRGFREVLWGVARYNAYYQAGGLGLWNTMADNQLAKCAEALALRKAFPEDLGGLYVVEEMDQAGAELVGEIVQRDPKPDNIVDRDVKPANFPQAEPPPPTTAPLLTAEETVITTYAKEFATVKSQRELDGLCWAVRRDAGTRPSKEFRAWFEEQRKQAVAAIGGAS